MGKNTTGNKRVRKSKLETEEGKNKLLKLQLENKFLTKKLQFVNKYDVVSTQTSSKRRQPLVEVGGESKQLSTYDRLRSVNLVRDLERNFSSARSLMTQIVNNVISSGPKCRVHTDDTDFNNKAEHILNTLWARDCDFRQPTHWGDELGFIQSAKVREGDVLVVFDDFIEDSGKLLIFESDQLVEISDPANAPAPYNTLQQDQGVWHDELGRVVGYSVTSAFGQYQLKASEAIFIPAENARLVKESWRPNTHRGYSAMLTASADLQDLYEARSKEIQTMKVLSSFAGVVKKENVTKEFTDLANINLDAGGTGSPTNYDRLEALTGGYLEYMEPTDSFDPIAFDRPSINFQEAFNFILRSAGSAMGIPKTYSTMSVEASYTAFRGENLIFWEQVTKWQKSLERNLCDWVADKVLNWYAGNGEITLPASYDNTKISWVWNQLKQVDPQKDAAADILRIGSLTADYSEIVGPDWKKKFEAISEQLTYAKSLGIPLDIIFGPAGAGVAVVKQITDGLANSNNSNDLEV